MTLPRTAAPRLIALAASQIPTRRRRFARPIQVNRFTDASGSVERSSIDPRFPRFGVLWEVKL